MKHRGPVNAVSAPLRSRKCVEKVSTARVAGKPRASGPDVHSASAMRTPDSESPACLHEARAYFLAGAAALFTST